MLSSALIDSLVTFLLSATVSTIPFPCTSVVPITALASLSALSDSDDVVSFLLASSLCFSSSFSEVSNFLYASSYFSFHINTSYFSSLFTPLAPVTLLASFTVLY